MGFILVHASGRLSGCVALISAPSKCSSSSADVRGSGKVLKRSRFLGSNSFLGSRSALFANSGRAFEIAHASPGLLQLFAEMGFADERRQGNYREGSRPYVSVLVIPDEVTRATEKESESLIVAFSQAADIVIVNQTALANLPNNLPPNVLPVDDWALAKFAAGRCALRMPRFRNRVGVVFDKQLEPALRERLLAVMDKIRDQYGIEIPGYTESDANLDVDYVQKTRVQYGDVEVMSPARDIDRIGNPGSLLRASDKLLSLSGADAVVVVSHYPSDDPKVDENYWFAVQRNEYPFRSINHAVSTIISKELGAPGAHVPAAPNARPNRSKSSNNQFRRPQRGPADIGNSWVDRIPSPEELLEEALLRLSTVPVQVTVTRYASKESQEKDKKDDGSPSSKDNNAKGGRPNRRFAVDALSSAWRNGELLSSMVDMVVAPVEGFRSRGLNFFGEEKSARVVLVEDIRGWKTSTKNLTYFDNKEDVAMKDGAVVQRAVDYEHALRLLYADRASDPNAPFSAGGQGGPQIPGQSWGQNGGMPMGQGMGMAQGGAGQGFARQPQGPAYAQPPQGPAPFEPFPYGDGPLGDFPGGGYGGGLGPRMPPPPPPRPMYTPRPPRMLYEPMGFRSPLRHRGYYMSYSPRTYIDRGGSLAYNTTFPAYAPERNGRWYYPYPGYGLGFLHPSEYSYTTGQMPPWRFEKTKDRIDAVREKRRIGRAHRRAWLYSRYYDYYDSWGFGRSGLWGPGSWHMSPSMMLPGYRRYKSLRDRSVMDILNVPSLSRSMSRGRLMFEHLAHMSAGY